jgi:hypothetical protein
MGRVIHTIQTVPMLDRLVLRLHTPSGNMVEVGKAPWTYHATENGTHSLCAYMVELKTYQDEYGVVYEQTIYKLASALNAWPLQHMQLLTLTEDPKLTVTEETYGDRRKLTVTEE